MNEIEQAWFIIERLLYVAKSVKSSIGVTKAIEDVIRDADRWLVDNEANP